MREKGTTIEWLGEHSALWNGTDVADVNSDTSVTDATGDDHGSPSPPLGCGGDAGTVGYSHLSPSASASASALSVAFMPDKDTTQNPQPRHCAGDMPMRWLAGKFT